MSKVIFTSNNKAFENGFEWAKEQALFYAHDNEKCGPCYEAALPRRRSFCMRDVSHQVIGGHFLGLLPHNKNMMRLFAEGISETRDYCSFWEITFDGDPTPVDYKDDSDFWYNLPANFDVMASCHELYELTGDEWYLTSPEIVRFFELSINEYLKHWDRDGDGIVDRVESEGRRGIASYDEGYVEGYNCAADALACEIAAFRAAAAMYRLLGNEAKAVDCEANAIRLSNEYDSKWWNDEAKCFMPFKLKDGSYGGPVAGTNSTMSLQRKIIFDKAKRDFVMEKIAKQEKDMIVEERSYVVKLFWKYGPDDMARKTFLKVTGPEYNRREYPEVSYAAADALITGYMGVDPVFSENTVYTRNNTAEGEWAELGNLPIWMGTIDLRHEQEKSILTNHTGMDFTWVNTKGTETKKTVVKNGETVIL